MNKITSKILNFLEKAQKKLEDIQGRQLQKFAEKQVEKNHPEFDKKITPVPPTTETGRPKKLEIHKNQTSILQ
jgi:hypothetical protein